MKLYQSTNQTLPSGPTSAAMGEVHSSSLASRFHELRERKPAPSGRITNVAIRWPVGSLTNAVLFQYSRGYARAVDKAGPEAAVKPPCQSTCRTLSGIGSNLLLSAVPVTTHDA